jgi:hypothetical protein
MRIADGKITSRCLNAALRATDGQERSAALPSGEGVAALLGVLAGGSGFTLRHYWRWALFRAGQRQALAANLRTNVFATQSFTHSVFPAPGRTPATGPFVNALAKCRAPAKLSNRNLRIFLVLRKPPTKTDASSRHTVPPRNKTVGS